MIPPEITIESAQRTLFVLAMIALGLFVVSSLIHLYFVYKESEAGRRLTKIIPLSFLSLSSLFLMAGYSILFLPAIFGFLFSIVGDFLFLYKKRGNRYLLVGIAAFFLAHVAFLLAIGLFFPDYASFFPWSLLYLPAVALAIAYPMYLFTKKNRPITVAGSVYFAFVTSLFFFFLLRLFDSKTPFSLAETLIGMAGAALFALSDGLNAYTLFRKDIRRRDFYIMLPYLGAQLLLYLSFILLPILGL